jgi:hypothetical protein
MDDLQSRIDVSAALRWSRSDTTTGLGLLGKALSGMWREDTIRNLDERGGAAGSQSS